MSPNAKVLHALIDTVDRELKTAVDNGTIEKEFHQKWKNIVSFIIIQVLTKLTLALGQDNAYHPGQP